MLPASRPPRPRGRLAGGLALSLLLPSLACTGLVSDPGASPDPSGGGAGARPGVPSGSGGATGGGGNGSIVVDPTIAACAASNGALDAGLTPARRLTRDQYNHTVRDLLGATG